MKTSSKLLITAILIIIGSMITYDLALRAEYRKGTYKSRFYGFEKTTSLKKFTSIDNRVANLVLVQIEQGNNYSIWVKNDLISRIKFSRKGSQLVIDVVDKNNPQVSAYQTGIFIICPSLDRVTTTPTFTAEEDAKGISYSNTTMLVGFNQQNLTLKVNRSTSLVLEKNKINNLDALVGNDLSMFAFLGIGFNNQINNAVIKVSGKNNLDIQNAKITKKDFNISDSAHVSLSGSFLNQIRK